MPNYSDSEMLHDAAAEVASLTKEIAALRAECESLRKIAEAARVYHDETESGGTCAWGFDYGRPCPLCAALAEPAPAAEAEKRTAAEDEKVAVFDTWLAANAKLEGKSGEMAHAPDEAEKAEEKCPPHRFVEDFEDSYSGTCVRCGFGTSRCEECRRIPCSCTNVG